MRKWGRTPVRRLGLAASLMLLTFACARNDDDSGTSTASNEGGSEPTSSNASQPSTTAQRADTRPSTPATTEAEIDATTPVITAEPADPKVTSVGSITELIAAGDALVGRTVELQAKAFFLEECPPPDATAGGPCSLLLFVGDADRDGLLYGERDLAVPGLLDGARVTCEVGPDTRTACAEWEQGALYEIVGTVRQQQFGTGVELDIGKRSPT